MLTRSTTLHQDVGPCSGNGITVAANNVTLNLNGHRVFGTDQSGEGAGVLLRHVSGVVVVNGTVEQFDGGVVIEGGARNSVVRVTARDNIGSSEGMSGPSETLYGDGIAVQGSSHNRIIGNHAVNNGPYSGIALYEVPDSDHPTTPANPVTNNVVHGNVVEDKSPAGRGRSATTTGSGSSPTSVPTTSSAATSSGATASTASPSSGAPTAIGWSRTSWRTTATTAPCPATASACSASRT